MQPSRVKHPVIPQHVRLLEVAQRAPLLLSPDRQPYIISPLTATAVPLYSEAFFDWFTHSTEARLGLCPSSSQIARVIRDLDSGARKAQATEQIHTRIAKKATKHYQIDLGTPNIDVVELTGKHWQVSQHFDARFQRLETSDPMPIPQPSPVKLPVYLENMFGISVESAGKLSGWLAQAMLPEQKPPILVITGEASDEAVTQLRNLIDPVFHALIEIPTTALITGPPALGALAAIRNAALLLATAEAAGGIAGVLDLTVDYLNTRTAFGRKIGSYQSLKHPCADILVGLERTRSHLYHAATLCASNEPAEIALRMAKAEATDVFAHAGDRAVQFHGGFGFTWDCDAQLYLRRALWLQYSFGDAAHHRRKLADLLLG